MRRLDKLRALLGARPRSCSFVDGRALVAYANVPPECVPALRAALVEAIRAERAIAWVDVNPQLQRVVFAADASKIELSRLCSLVERAEEVARSSAVVLGAAVAQTPAHELPDDELALAQQWVQLCADVAGLGYGLLLRLVPFAPAGLGSRAVLLLSWIQSTPSLRRPLDARLGVERADLLLSLCLSQAQAVSQRPLSSVVDIARRAAALRERRARQRVYERMRSQLLYDPAGGPLFAMRAEAERPVPLPQGPVELHVQRAWLPAAGAFSVSLLATRELGRATAALFGALPSPAKLGREMFVTELGRTLAERGMLVLSPQALRRLDRIDSLVIDRALLTHTRLSLGKVVSLDKRPPAELRGVAQALFDPQQPLECRSHGGYQLAPLARTAFAREARALERAEPLQQRGSLVLALSAVNGARDQAHTDLPGGQLLGLVELQIAAHPGGELLIELARQAKLHVALCTDADVTSLAPAEGVELIARADLVERLRALQRFGHSVCLMAAGDSPGLAVADFSMAVSRQGVKQPLGAHVLCGEDVGDFLLALRAILSARGVSEQSVRVALATAVANTLIAASARRRTNRNVVFVSSAASLLAMSNAVLRTASLRVSEVPGADGTPFHALEPNAVLTRLGSSNAGLHDGEAAHRARDVAREPGLLRELMAAVRAELDNPFTPFIVAGAGLSALVGSRVDAALVGGTGLLGALLGGAQRVRTERALRSIVRPSRQPVSVLRRHRRSLADTEIVVGDVILLRAGDVVPADCRILESSELEVDGASLTGESLPNAKTAAASFEPSLADRSSMLYAGTTVVAGRAKAVVVATGEQVEALRAASAQPKRRRDSGVEARLRELTDLTLPVASLGAAAIMVAGILRGRKPQELISSSISMGVAALPEGLPLLATAAQLTTAQRLTRHGALVRNASCIEALGRVDVVCIDKTGTLTEGLIELSCIAAAGEIERALVASQAADAGAAEGTATRERDILAAALRATPDGELGNTTDAALVRAARRAGVRRQHAAPGFQLHTDYPFASAHGYHGVVARTQAGGVLTLKGAAERVLPFCDAHMVGGERVPLDAPSRAAVLEQVAALAGRGLRVLAVAERRLEPGASLSQLSPRSPEGLCLLGVLGFRDPVRSNARRAVEKLRQAGVRVLMLTGDHVETARSIAREVSLLDREGVLSGGEIAQWDDPALQAHVDDVALCARVTPAQKVRIVRALVERGHVVAMVGDGANDAPAMHAAQVGIAVGKNCAGAAQVAADIVFPAAGIDSLLEGIVDARAMWLSIRDAVSILLGGNLGEIGFASVAGLLSGSPPLNPRQLLLVNLFTDVAPAMAVAMRTPPGDLFEQLKHQSVDDLLGQPLDRAILVRALSTAAGAGWAWGVGRVIGSRARASTLALTALVGAQLGQTLGSRGADPSVLVTSLTSAFMLAAIVQTPGVSHFFGCRPLGPIGWSVALSASAGATAAGVLWTRLEPHILAWLGALERAESSTAQADADGEPGAPGPSPVANSEPNTLGAQAADAPAASDVTALSGEPPGDPQPMAAGASAPRARAES